MILRKQIGARLFFILFSAFTLALHSNFLITIGIEAGIGGAQIQPSGTIRYKGETLDVKNELKYDKYSTFVGKVRIDMPLLIPNILLSATPMRFDATGSKNAGFQFGDVKTFQANVPFTSSLRLDHYDLTLFYGIPFIETVTNEKLRVDLGLNARVIDLKAEINQSQSGLKESKSTFVPVPMVFAALQIKPIEKISINGELKAIAYGSSRYYDVLGSVRVPVFKVIFIGAGYKYQNIRIDSSDVKTDLEFSGPVAEAGVEF